MLCRDFREIACSFLDDELLVETNHDVIKHAEGYCQLNLIQRWIRHKNKSNPSPSATSSLNFSPLQAAN